MFRLALVIIISGFIMVHLVTTTSHKPADVDPRPVCQVYVCSK